MWEQNLFHLIENLKNNKIDTQSAVREIIQMVSGELGFAEVDTSRSLRTGFPEVIFCPNKEDQDIFEIVQALAKNQRIILLTKARESTFLLLKRYYKNIHFHKKSGAITLGKIAKGIGKVTIVCAGTSDIPIAEEAKVTAQVMGSAVVTNWDIGVAGLHRLISKLKSLRTSKVIIAVAGMDSARPGVIAGLVSCPVIAVPTSIGYGTNMKGIAPLLTMLNSCAPGVAVVNIDNGFGAGYIASLINCIGE